MAKVTLDDIINDSFPEIVEILKKDFRKELDSRITILDLSYEALKVNVYRNTKAHIEAYDYAYEALERALGRIAKRTYTSLEDLPPGYFEKKNSSYVYINGGKSNRFIVANSFGAIDSVVREISRDKEIAKTSFGVSSILTPKKDTKGRVLPDEYSKEMRRKVDIGHISTADSENLTSPLEEKIRAVMQFGTSVNNPLIVESAKKALDSLYSIQVDASYSFKNTTPEAIKLAQKTLGEGYVVVTLHRQKLNNKFSTEEAQIFFKLKSAIAKAVAKSPFEVLSGSNNIVEDIAEAVLHILNPAKYKSPKKHKQNTKTTKKQTIKANTYVSNKSVRVPKLRNLKGQFTSLVNLQNLINSQLQDVISANMGDGNSKNVLNYRTGRFAASASVEHMSESRQGMITAFYSYMKNPYQTFEPGFKQGSPASRNPKLLISKSIREIAATHVGNRLRAVSV
jgi:hypothetical protein